MLDAGCSIRPPRGKQPIDSSTPPAAPLGMTPSSRFRPFVPTKRAGRRFMLASRLAASRRAWLLSGSALRYGPPRSRKLIPEERSGTPETFLQMIRRINCIATSFCRRPRDPPRGRRHVCPPTHPDTRYRIPDARFGILEPLEAREECSAEVPFLTLSERVHFQSAGCLSQTMSRVAPLGKSMDIRPTSKSEERSRSEV